MHVRRSIARPHDSFPQTSTTGAFRRAWAVAGLVAASSLSHGQILAPDSVTLETRISGIVTANPVQDQMLRPEFQGIHLDGSVRKNPPHVDLAGNPFEASRLSDLGGINLATGTYDRRFVDLPGAGWTHAREYNARQHDGTGDHDSDGPQGVNWAHTSQPELDAVVMSSAPRWVILWGMAYYVFDLSDTPASGVNGVNGRLQYVDDAIDYYVLWAPGGDKLYFLPFDLTETYAQGQFWKHEYPDGSIVYAGIPGDDTDDPQDAIDHGYYDGTDPDTEGKIKSVVDLDGFQFAYTYDGTTGRLTSVERKNADTTPVVIDKVEYTYYGSGDLELVTRTTDLSDSSEKLVQKSYYRYNTSGLLEMVVDPEGYRQADLDEDGLLNDDPLNETTITDAELQPYTTAHFKEYADRKITKVYFNGQCGCTGGDNGEMVITYWSNGSFSDAAGTYDQNNNDWQTRAVVDPSSTLVDTDTVYYFDDVGQSLSRVRRTDLSGTPNNWVTKVLRNADGVVTQVATPASIDTYTHSTGAIALKSGAGLINTITRTTGAVDLRGFATADSWMEGSGGSDTTIRETAYSTRDYTFGVGQALKRPYVTSRTVYEDATTSHTTSYAHTYSTGEMLPDKVATTMPTVAESKNGSGVAITSTTYYDDNGRICFTESPDGIIDYTGYDPAGRVLVRVRDADTNETGSGKVFENVTIPTGLSSTTGALHLVTTMTYDEVGRLERVTKPNGDMMEYHLTRLADHVPVRLVVPFVDTSGTTAYYGPVSYQVSNQAGRTTFAGTIAITGGSTTTDVKTWVNTSEDEALSAVSGSVGSVTHVTTTLYDSAGQRPEETRRYHHLPGTWPGSATTNYDATQTVYDELGRRVEIIDSPGTSHQTIHKTVFDDLDRPIESWGGTDDGTGVGVSISDMVKTSATEYDSGGVGNGYVTKRSTDADGDWDAAPNDDLRETVYAYDVRGRLLLTTRPGTPKYTLNKYDNLGRLVAAADYKGDGSGDVGATDDPTSRATDRLTLNETKYDEQGRVWKTTRHNISQGTGASADTLDAFTWYDDEGRAVKVDGEQLTKTSYDRIGRAINMFTLASDNDPAAGATGTNAAAQTVTGDIVLEEHQTHYENETGNVLMSVAIERHWDDYGTGETTGALDTDTDLSLVDASEVVGRVQITAMWYDDLDRPIKTALYGTNGGSDFERDDFADRTSTDPIAIPTASSSDLLLTITTYGDDGDITIAEDPAGRETRFEYDDAGRRTKVTRNYVDGAPSSATGDDDQVVKYEYTDGLMTAMIAENGPSASQTTSYDYGTTKGAGATDSAIASGRLLFQVIYPEESSGSPSVADRTVTYGYNAQSQRDYQKDQDGNVIETVYDDLGRPITVKLTTVITGYDDTVRRIETAYDDRGMVSTVDQYDATSAGNRLDRISYGYASWAMLTSETIDCDTPARSNMPVSYTYGKATTGRNTIRRTNMSTQFETADGFNFAYNYSSTGGLHDNDASRVTTVQQFSTDLVEYRYNGLGTLVTTTYTEPDVFTSLDGPTARTYDRLDQFNRQVSSIWTKDNVNVDVDFYDVDIAYDYNSNITRTLDNILRSGLSHLFDYSYTLDSLDRVADAKRGHWDGSSIDTLRQREVWTLDQLGNWDLYQLDRDGNGTYTGADELNDDRTHDGVNQLAERDIDDSGTDDFTLLYDKTGNLIDDAQDYKFVYDPLGRLVEIQDQSSNLVSEYRYDGLGRRIAFRHDTDSDASMLDEHWYHLAYDDQWRIVAISRDEDESPKEEFAWHNAGLDGTGASSYIDSVIFRDRDYNTAWSAASDEVLERRDYYVQNWRADVVALLTDLGKQVEFIRHRPYGEPFAFPAGDTNSDGDADVADANNIAFWSGGYDVRFDVDLDGTVDPMDDLDFTEQALGSGVLSGVSNRIGYAGYVFDDDITRFAHVRFRVYDTTLGRWTRRDPLSRVDGLILYQYGKANPLAARDPMGLCAACIIPFDATATLALTDTRFSVALRLLTFTGSVLPRAGGSGPGRLPGTWTPDVKPTRRIPMETVPPVPPGTLTYCDPPKCWRSNVGSSCWCSQRCRFTRTRPCFFGWRTCTDRGWEDTACTWSPVLGGGACAATTPAPGYTVPTTSHCTTTYSWSSIASSGGGAVR